MAKIVTHPDFPGLVYYPETGTFYRELPKGTARKGYTVLKYRGTSYRAGRMAFVFMTGSPPANEVDHINNNRADDRWENLRDVTPSLNQKNKGIQRNNTSGIRGVHLDRGRWVARIATESGRRNLYSGKDFFEACCRRKSAENRHGYISL